MVHSTLNNIIMVFSILRYGRGIADDTAAAAAGSY